MILRPCLVCGRPTRRTRCSAHQEQERRARQPWRAVYATRAWRRARRQRLDLAGGRCEAVLPDGARCTRPAVEVHHLVPLSTAQTWQEALALCGLDLLRAVCRDHHPRRGGGAKS